MSVFETGSSTCSVVDVGVDVLSVTVTVVSEPGCLRFRDASLASLALRSVAAASSVVCVLAIVGWSVGWSILESGV